MRKASGQLGFELSNYDIRNLDDLDAAVSSGLRDDVSYEVLESDLIQKYCAWNMISSEEGYRHFKLCFNAVGVFDVLCKTITVT